MKKKRKLSFKRQPIIFNSPSKLPFDNLCVQNQITECEPDFLVRECKCGRTVVLTGCMRKDCIQCTGRLNHRRSSAAFDRFNAIKKIRNKQNKRTIFCYTDFTIPPILRQGFVNKKRWQALRQQLWFMLHFQYGAIFALEGTHPIGDKNSEVFHPHLNFVWVIDDDHNPYIDVDELRGFLQVFLKYLGPVDVWHQYSEDIAKLRHWCKYVTRIFPEFSGWAGSIRWYGDYPNFKKESECYCSVCEEKFRTIGSLPGHLVNNFEERGFFMGRAPPWENDKLIRPFKRLNLS